jgi:hypothetical protein
MNKVTLRFVILAAAMTLCLLAQHPQYASAAACPFSSCSTLLANCHQAPCHLLSFTRLGTCTKGGVNRPEYLVRCTCGGGMCYE